MTTRDLHSSEEWMFFPQELSNPAVCKSTDIILRITVNTVELILFRNYRIMCVNPNREIILIDTDKIQRENFNTRQVISCPYTNAFIGFVR